MIAENVKALLNELPEGVELEAAAKTRSAEEIEEAVKAGVKIIGENYIKDIKKVYDDIKTPVRWHFIGTLKTQKHDLLRKKYLKIFDMIETLDSFEIACELDKKCASIPKIMDVLIEVNSAKEPQKSGVMPEDTKELAVKLSTLKNIRVVGLMTMGPRFGNPEDSRPYFRITKELFEEIKSLKIPNLTMKYLSMGMTNSYKVAIQEGANIVRIGTKIFGERACRLDAKH